jgi:hypothetical protein
MEMYRSGDLSRMVRQAGAVLTESYAFVAGGAPRGSDKRSSVLMSVG